MAAGCPADNVQAVVSKDGSSASFTPDSVRKGRTTCALSPFNDFLFSYMRAVDASDITRNIQKSHSIQHPRRAATTSTSQIST